MTQFTHRLLLFVAALAVLVAPLVTAALAGSLDRTVEGYLRAVQAGDRAAIERALAPDAVSRDMKGGARASRADIVAANDYEFETRTHIAVSGATEFGDTVTVTERRTSEALKLIGVEALQARVTYRLRDGKIIERLVEPLDDVAVVQRALEPFKAWVLRNHPQDAQQIFVASGVAQNEASGKKVMTLLKEWGGRP